MADHIDSWRGFRVEYPDGWRVLYPPLEGVAFDSPETGDFLEFSFLKPGEASDALYALTHRLRLFPPHEARLLEGTTPTQASLTFRQEHCSGQLRARWTPQGATVVLAQSRQNTDLTSLLQTVLATLMPIPPIPRHPFHEPRERSLSLLLPEGWEAQAGVMGSPPHRTPMARVHAGPNVWAAVEPEFQTYLEPQAFGMGPRLPFQGYGLRPLLEHVWAPRWQQQGLTVLGYEDFGNPKAAEVRLLLPDGGHRVVALQGAVVGEGTWIGGPVSTYQGPLDGLRALEPVLRGVIQSVAISPAWRAAETANFHQQLAFQNQQSQQWMQQQQSLHNQRMHDIQAQGQANTQIHQARMEGHDAQFQSFQQQSAAQDGMHHDTINMIRERTDYVDAEAGKVYNLPTGHERVWSDGQGHLFGGDWRIDPPSDWHELKPL